MKTHLRFLILFSLALILAVSAIGFVPVTPARAAALVVNSLDDTDDGTCDGTHCSLREAINDALNAATDDSITFSVNGTIRLSSTLPIITNDGALIIDGGNNITISGDSDGDNDGDVRILYIHPSAVLTLQNLTLDRGLMTTDGGGAIKNSGTLTLNNVTVSNGVTTAAFEGGGAIYNSSGSAALTLVDSTITGNTSTRSGGAIYNIGGSVTVTDSVLSANFTDESGGAIYNSGPLTITGGTFTSNQALGGGGGAINEVTPSGTPSITGSMFFDNQAQSGGAIHLSQATMTVSESTFESNDATTNDAGGIYVAGSATLNVTNSTFSANTTASRGGGIFSFNPVTLTNVTVSDNSGAGGAGGVHMYDTLTITNTIIANNVTGGDCILDSGGSVSGTSSDNLIEDAANACGLTDGVDGNIVGDDPLLGPLQNNGGTTETHALLSGSPAINTGTNTGCPATDQTGAARPQGGMCDIGAVELPHTTLTVTSVGVNDGWVLESTETSGVGGSMNSTSTLFYIGDGAADKQYISILHFDTAGLPDTAVITTATLKVKKYAVVGTDPFTILGGLLVDMRRPTFGSVGLTVGDFQTVAGRVGVATFGTVPVSNWYSAILNGPGRNYINKTGTTQFRLRFTTDDNDDGATDYMKFYSGNHANSAVWPMLVIEYYVP
ncbi:MAG: choice-of-anchor Q domain-containing protein [Chloroflexota bacterium]